MPDYAPPTTHVAARVRSHRVGSRERRYLWVQPEDGPRLDAATRLAVELAQADPRWRVPSRPTKSSTLTDMPPNPAAQSSDPDTSIKSARAATADDLAWLADAPLFIDEDLVGRFYDATVMPDSETGDTRITFSKGSGLKGAHRALLRAP